MKCDPVSVPLAGEAFRREPGVPRECRMGWAWDETGMSMPDD